MPLITGVWNICFSWHRPWKTCETISFKSKCINSLLQKNPWSQKTERVVVKTQYPGFTIGFLPKYAWGEKMNCPVHLAKLRKSCGCMQYFPNKKVENEPFLAWNGIYTLPTYNSLPLKNDAWETILFFLGFGNFSGVNSLLNFRWVHVSRRYWLWIVMSIGRDVWATMQAIALLPRVWSLPTFPTVWPPSARHTQTMVKWPRTKPMALWGNQKPTPQPTNLQNPLVMISDDAVDGSEIPFPTTVWM